MPRPSQPQRSKPLNRCGEEITLTEIAKRDARVDVTAIVVNARCIDIALSNGTEAHPLRSQKRKRRGKMRKAIAELDAEERAALIYLADLGTAMCASGLIVSLLKLMVDVL